MEVLISKIGDEVMFPRVDPYISGIGNNIFMLRGVLPSKSLPFLGVGRLRSTHKYIAKVLQAFLPFFFVIE